MENVTQNVTQAENKRTPSGQVLSMLRRMLRRPLEKEKIKISEVPKTLIFSHSAVDRT